MTTRDLPAIDVHAHYGDYTFQGTHPRKAQCMTGDAAEVARRAKAVNVEWTVVSPLLALFPRGEADAAEGNDQAARLVPSTDGLLQWAVIDPQRLATYEQADRLLNTDHCVGIKIHPEEHCYPIAEHARDILTFAAERKAVVLTHSGHERSMPHDVVPIADDFPEMQLILAHIGCGYDGDPTHQVRGIQMSRAGNVFADTSSMSSIMPRLIEWAVSEVGVERVLFGTDTPLYSTAMQRARIDDADLSDADKRAILRDNAIRLLGGKTNLLSNGATSAP